MQKKDKNTETDELATKNTTQRKKRNRIKKMIYSFLIFVLIFDVFLYFFATPVFKTYIQNKVLEKSEGLYRIDFDKIRFELSQRHIELTNFSLKPDTVVYQHLVNKGSVKTAVYDISVNSLQLWGTSFYKLFFKQNLKVKEFFIDNPVIKLKKLPNNSNLKTENRDFIHEDLYPLISKYVSILNIKYINLENGKFQLRLSKKNKGKTSHFGAISVKLYNFYLDKRIYEKPEQLFYSNDIQILLSNYRIQLADRIHNFHAKSIYISTKESLLKAKSVSILPEQINKQENRTQKSNYYYFKSAEIDFHNFNIRNLYFNKNIEIQNIIIKTPKIKIHSIKKKRITKSDTANKNEAIKFDFYKLIKGSLNSVSIKTLDLNRAELELFIQSKLSKPEFHISDFNLSLLDFLLDKDSGKDKKRILYAKNIRLNLNDFNAKILNNTHTLKAKHINIHTDTKSLYINNLNIFPIKNSNFKQIKLSVNLSNIQLSGTDFYRFLKTKELIIKKMQLGKSNIDIALLKKSKNKANNIVNQLSGTFLKKLSIYNLVLKNTDFNIINHKNDSTSNSYSGKVSLNLGFLNFIRGAHSLKKMFSLYRFKLSISNYSQEINDQIHQLNADNIYVSNTDSLIEVKNLEIHPKYRSYKNLKNLGKQDIIDLSIKNTRITGIDMKQLVAQENLSIKNIQISRPLFKTLHYPAIIKTTETDSLSKLLNDSLNNINKPKLDKNLKTLLARYFKNINIKKIDINKGIFLFSESDTLDNEKINSRGRLSLKLKNFNYDYNADSLNKGKIKNEALDIHINEFYQHLKQQTYLIKAKKLYFSQKDSLFKAEIVRWFPDKNSPDSMFGKNIITAYSPEISFKGIELNRFLNTNILHLGILNITSPSISLIKNKDYNPKQQKQTVKKFKLPFEKIITDSIIISRGYLGILKNKKEINEKLLNTGFDVSISNIQIDSTFIDQPLEQLKKLASIIHLKNFKFKSADKKISFDFNHFYLNSSKKLLFFSQLLYYTSQTDSLKNPLETFYIPLVKISNFSYGDLLSNRLLADSLQIFEPYFVLLNNANKKKTNPLEINLYEKTKKVFEKIHLSNINIENAAFKIKNKSNINKPVTDYNQIYVSIKNLLIDSLHQNDEDKFFNTSDISFLIKNYSTNINKGFYKIDADEIGFSTGKQKIYAKNVLMNPTASREELAKRSKTEIKLLYINAPEITIEHPDFKSFIANNKIIAQNISLNNLKVHSFKNKQFPMDSVEKSALPFEDLKKMKTYVKIDTISLHNFYVGIELLGANSTHSGYFDITEIDGIITNITNDKQLINNGLVTKIIAHGKIMDEGFLSASFRFPLNSSSGEYYYGGKLAAMNIEAFNPLLENLYFVSIRDGKIDSLAFNISANDDYAIGNMKFVYHKLKFDIHNKKKTDSLIVNKRGLVSMLANSIVKNDNPKHKGGRIKSAKIYYERDIYHSVFHYWAMTALSGIKTTMGFKSKELKERLKWEKIYERNKRVFAKKEKKINRKEKRKNRKEINKDVKADLRREEKEKKKTKINHK